MGTFVSAGSYFRELDFSEYAPQLSTSIIGFVGTAIKGPINELTFVTNPDQAIAQFGNPTPNSFLMYSVLQALKKANKVWIVRVAGGSSNGAPYTSAAKATVNVPGGASAGVVRSSNYELFNIEATQKASHTGTELENFTISVAGLNNQFSYRYDIGAGWVVPGGNPFTIPDGVYTAAALAVIINGFGTNINCSDDGNGKLKIESVLSGPTIKFELLAVANSCYTTLGLTVGVYTGSAGTDSLRVDLVGTGAGTQTFTLPSGSTVTAQQIATLINLTATNFTASANDSGGVVLTKTQTGTTESIQVHADSTCDAVIGWDNLVHAGTNGGSTTLVVWASSEGTWANYLGENPGVYVTVSAGTILGTFKLEVFTANGILRGRWNNLSKDPDDDNYFVDIVNADGEYITVVDVPAVTSNPTNASYQLALGADGISDVIDADYIGTTNGINRYGLQLFNNPETLDVNLLCIPGVTSEAVQVALMSMCEETRRDCFAILDTPYGLNVQEAADFSNGEGSFSARPSLNSSYAAIYWPWVRIYDEYNAQNIWIPPCGFVLATYAHTDFIADVWWAPAGLIRGRCLNALELEYSPNQGERDFLYGDGNIMNPFVDFTGDGIVIWGQRTTQRRPSALDRVNVRRMLLYAEKVVATSARYLVFEQNDAPTWRRYVRLVEPIFESIKHRRGLYDFRVVCDETTNPPEQIDQNQMSGKILLKPTKSAEIIVTDFIIVATGASFEEFL